jgi:hypothetical protein
MHHVCCLDGNNAPQQPARTTTCEELSASHPIPTLYHHLVASSSTSSTATFLSFSCNRLAVSMPMSMCHLVSTEKRNFTTCLLEVMWAKVCTGARPDSIQSRTRNPMQNSVKNVGREIRNSAEARSRTTYSRKNTEAPIFRQ